MAVKVETELQLLQRSTEDAIKDKIDQNMKKVVSHYKWYLEKMLGPAGGRRTGKEYINLKGKARHQASKQAPNPFARGAEWPAELSGELRGSFRESIRGHSGNRWVGVVYTISPYATALEFGTEWAAARPLMRVAAQDPPFTAKAEEFAKDGFLTDMPREIPQEGPLGPIIGDLGEIGGLGDRPR